MAPKFIDLTDHEYNDWTVLEFAGIDKHKSSLWKCQCKCGNVKIVTRGALRQNRSTKCKKCSHREYCGKLSGNMYSRLVGKARKTGRKFDLSKEFLWNLYLKQDGKCALSGVPIDFADGCYEEQRGGTTASLDRKDSSLDYTKDNVQWVHKDVNWMKQDFDDEYFIQVCKLIAEYNS